MAEDLHTIGIQVEADSSQAAKLTRALQELAQQMERTAQNQQKLRSNMQQSQQQMTASGGAAGYMMGQMKALAAQMLAMVGIVALVNKGIHEFADALAQAARLEEEADNFVDLADNAKNAQKALQDIQAWWRGAGGIFDQKDIMAAANALAALHVKAEQIPTILQKLGDAAETSGGSLQDWVSTIGTFLAGRFIGQGTTEMKLLLNETALAAGQSTEKIKQVLAKAKPDEIIAALEKGLSRIGTVSSKTFDQAADAATRYDGQMRVLSSRWLFLKEQFGTPIIDALTPILEKWNKELAGGGSTAHNFGQAVADSITNAVKRLEEETIKTGDKTQAILMLAFKGLFSWLVAETKVVWTFLFITLPKAAWDEFSPWFKAGWDAMSDWLKSAHEATWSDISKIVVKTWDGTWEAIKSGASKLGTWLKENVSLSFNGQPIFTATGTPQAPNQFLTGQAPTFPVPLGMQPPPAFNMTAGAVAGAAGAQGDVTGALEHVQAGIRNLNDTDKAVKQLTGDAKILTDFWEDMTDAWQHATSSSALQAKQLEAVAKAAKGLVDPISQVNELTKGMAPDTAVIAKWILYEEAAQRSIALTDLRMKAGMASMGQSVAQGLKLMSRSWGTWQEQVSKGIQEIGNALVSNISGGLKDILNGTKSVKEGFRDMALGIIQAIEDVIIKMLVQLAIQQAIAALSGGTWFGGNLTQAAGPIRPAIAVGHQEGGPISGAGTEDTIPAMLAPGEFVINRRSAQHIGLANLHRLNKMEAGGVVHSGRHYYQDVEIVRENRTHGPRDFGRQNRFDMFDIYGAREGMWLNMMINRGFMAPPGTAGFLQGPTMIPTTFNAQGYPRAVALGPTADVNLLGTSHHTPPKQSKQYGGLITAYGGGGGVEPPSLRGNRLGFGIIQGDVNQALEAMYGPAEMMWARQMANQGSPSRGAWMYAQPIGPDVNIIGGSKHMGQRRSKHDGGLITYHSGGIVSPWAEFQSGGTVAHGEGVFTPEQMARLSPSTSNQSNQINVNVTNVGGGRSEVSTAGSGLTDKDAREMARAVLAVVQAQIAKEKRVGGALYVSHTAKGG